MGDLRSTGSGFGYRWSWIYRVALCDVLLSQSYSVLCVDNLLTGSKKNIAKLLTRKDFTFIQHDVTRDYLSWDG